jgi:hypothetical protein
MPPRRIANELNGVSVIRPVKHVERLAEAQIAEDVHGQPVTPVGHVARGGPALLLAIAGAPAELGAEGADVVEDVPLRLLDGAVGEGVREDAALAGVHVPVPRVVRVGGRMDEGVVKVGLADVGAEAVDVLQCRVGVEGQAVGAEADYWTWG